MSSEEFCFTVRGNIPIDKHDHLNCGLPRNKRISINMTEISSENPSHFFKTIHKGYTFKC